MTDGAEDRWAGTQALGAGAEFDVVRDLVARWGALASGIGDDAAVLDVPAGMRLVVSTDSSVEDVHFRRAWLTPEEIGYRATASAFSDLAAMGARPIGAVVALTVPTGWRSAVGGLADGIGTATRDAGGRIVGGDLSAGEQLTITVTVLGTSARPVGRSGAQPGGRVFVTGALGGPLLALGAFERGDVPRPADRVRFAHPVARVREGMWLAARGAVAMIDLSDGLAADLGHIAAASAVRLVVEAQRVPRVAGASSDDALRSGEEYELAVVMPPETDAAALERAFTVEFGAMLTYVGRVEAVAHGARPAVVLDAYGDGARVDLPPGHDHFSR